MSIRPGPGTQAVETFPSWIISVLVVGGSGLEKILDPTWTL